MPKVHDLTGKHFGRLKILERNPKNDNHGGSRLDCECDCGNKITVQAGNLKNNHTQSCGCLNKEVTSKTNSTHGLTNTPEYYTWAAIKRRCYGTYSPDYPDYGGRGIVMCDEWKNDFTVFLRDMGPRPSSSHSIDRKNNDKGYDKENCRWATRSEQQRNKRNSRSITFRGETKNVVEWAELYGLHYTTLAKRVFHLGWDIERALTTPTR